MTLAAHAATVRRGDFRLLAEFETPRAGITVVFGPSGSGKSMLLGMLAGLHRLDAGRVMLGDRVLEDVATGQRLAPHQRGVGLVFQDARLFPHLSVRGNLAFALKRAPKDPAIDDAKRLDEVAAELELGDLLGRSVRNLSGGEKSRVALARALLARPTYLLLDEPFAALDGRRRRAFLALLARLNARRSLPMMVVTHQIDDVAELADQVIALKDGRIVASGPAAATLGQADFLALLDPRDVGASIAVDAIEGVTGGGRAVWVRANAVLIASERPHGLSARNLWEGRIDSLVPEVDGAILVGVATSAGLIRARITRQAVSDLALAPGGPAWVVVKTSAL